MPPKRATNNKGKAPAPPSPKSSETSEEFQGNVFEVDWAIPKAKRRDIPDQRHIEDYAQPLYDMSSDELQPVQAALPEAQIRTPIYQKDNGRDMQPGDANSPSPALCHAFNHIKRRSVSEPDGLHDIAAVTELFDTGDENTVVILSGAEDVLALGAERRLQVTIGDQIAHIDFVRRAPQNEKATRLGYFIELPQGTSVTINGLTYENNGASSPTPFFIGPLQDYVVIELLSQPVFFFRHKESLKSRNSARRVHPDELRRRDRNGDVSADNVRVRWLPLESPEHSEEESVHGADTIEVEVGQSGHAAEELAQEHHSEREEPAEGPTKVAAEETLVEAAEENTGEDIAESAGEPTEELPAEPTEELETQPTEESTAQPMEESTAQPLEELTAEPMEESIAKPAEQPRAEEEEYSDAFTEGRKPITDPCAYIQDVLKMHANDRIASIIPRVLASINQRQPENSGFSFVYKHTVFRPGRTLLTALTDSGRYLLLVGQIQPDKSIRLRVLYPRTFRIQKHHRTKIDTDSRNWFMKTDWWRNAFDSHEQMVSFLPADIEWTPCAQTATQEGTFTYTILNAWALAMGLEPDPTFTPNSHGKEAFFIKAERIFGLALSDSLKWKVLLAFLRCTRFVKLAATAEGENSEDVGLPAKNRRFDQRKRSFRALIADQKHADDIFPGKKLDTEQLAVQLEDGVLHSAPFASDSFADEDRDILTRLVGTGGWKLQYTAEQLRQRLTQLGNESDDYSTKNSPSMDLLSETPELDGLAIPDNFNPCGHLREFVALEELFHRCAKEKPLATTNTVSGGEDGSTFEIPRLDEKDIEDSIATVVRAVNQRYPPGAGFITASSKGEVNSFIGDSNDANPLFMFKAGDSHELCVLVQETTEGIPSCTIIDSARGAISYQFAMEIRNQLREDFGFTQPIPWTLGPQQASEYHSGYHVVLNAWSIALGLPLNGRGFKSSPNFIRDAYYVIKAALEGEVDWLLIWALLRCQGYVASAEAPETERRFTKTIPSSEHGAYVKEMRSNQKKVATRPKITVYDHFQAGSNTVYDEGFDWDSCQESGIIGFSELQPSGVFDNTLISDGIQEEAQSTETFEPCKYLRDTLDMLLADDKINAELEALRSGNVTTQKGKWLQDDEVALTISAVFMAINEMQSMEEGFSIVPQACIQATGYKRDKDFQNSCVPVLRPGRPLIAPIVFRSHITLFVAQLDDQGRPAISFVDSMAGYYKFQQREELFQLVWRLLSYTSWWRGVFPDKNAFDRVQPATGLWVHAAHQPGSNECGYFTVLNAWALGLGLELNPSLRLRWTDAFFQQVQDVMHLVRLGRADWKLIFAFLRCHNIVRDGIVPENRRFASTHDTRAEERFNDELDQLRDAEESHWENHGYDDELLKLMRNCNRVPNMSGKPISHAQPPPSDSWDKGLRTHEQVGRLERFGKLDISHDINQIHMDHEKLMRTLVENCLNKVPSATSASGKSARGVLVEAIRNEINRHYEGMDSTIEKNPGAWVGDILVLYEAIGKNPKIQKILGYSNSAKPNDWKHMMEDSQLNLSMVSVLEAIDSFQSDLHLQVGSQSPFAGGFSLTTSTNLQLALNASTEVNSMVLSRPRRAWLIPLIVTKDSLLPQLTRWAVKNRTWKRPTGTTNGHSFLALVQEVASSSADNPDATEFEIQIFDSHLSVFKGAEEFFRERIESAARRLGWSTHRNDAGGPDFDGEIIIRDDLPRQRPGGYQCGYHVLINTWILALGLHYNPNAVYLDQIYRELHALDREAKSGLLHWKTLAAWLFSHKLTIESEFSAVPEDRRFGFTVAQTNENALQERIVEQYSVTDNILETLDISEAPYDHSNNLIEPRFGSETECDTSSDGGDDPRGLERRVDDGDLDLFGRPRGIKRKRRQGSDDGLRFLDRYDSRHEGWKRVADRCSSASKKRRVGDDLSFLDVY